jgi:hypothetical protein
LSTFHKRGKLRILDSTKPEILLWPLLPSAFFTIILPVGESESDITPRVESLC